MRARKERLKREKKGEERKHIIFLSQTCTFKQEWCIILLVNIHLHRTSPAWKSLSNKTAELGQRIRALDDLTEDMGSILSPTYNTL